MAVLEVSPGALRSVLLSALLLGCNHTAETTAWPEADAMMRTSSRWRGGDSAYSVPLSDGRVLWLFGDSFVGAGDGGGSRAGRAMVRNTVGIQSSTDPTTSTMTFFHGDEDPAAPFIASEGDLFYWPGPASRIGDGLLLTFARIRAVETGLGFETFDSRAHWVGNTAGDPTGWMLEPATLPEAPPGVQLGYGAHLTDGAWLYAFAPVEPGSHDVYLGRWAKDDLEEGRLDELGWWTDGTWTGDPSRARPIVRNLQTEFSVSRVGNALWMVSTKDFGHSDIVVRTAARPQGPWSEPAVLHRPSEYGRDGVTIYSAKVHPHLEGAPVVLTYCTNRTDFWDLASDLSVYFPRFVRVNPRLR